MYPAIGSYSKQGFNIFYNNMPVSDASFVSFKDLGEGWGKDIDKVFFMGRHVPGADPFFFKILGGGYAKDKNHVYYHGQIMPGVDPFGFQPPPNNRFMNNPGIFHPMQGVPSSVYTGPPIIHAYPPPPIPTYVHSDTMSTHIPISHQTHGRPHITGTVDASNCSILL